MKVFTLNPAFLTLGLTHITSVMVASPPPPVCHQTLDSPPAAECARGAGLIRVSMAAVNPSGKLRTVHTDTSATRPPVGAAAPPGTTGPEHLHGSPTVRWTPHVKSAPTLWGSCFSRKQRIQINFHQVPECLQEWYLFNVNQTHLFLRLGVTISTLLVNMAILNSKSNCADGRGRPWVVM